MVIFMQAVTLAAGVNEVHNRRWMLALFLVALALYVYGNGWFALTDPDETVYAETAREMLASGDLISPRIYGQYWYDKPALFYWLTAAAIKVGGLNEAAARFPSALGGALGVAVVFAAGSSMFRSRRAGLLSAVLLMTSGEYFYLAKAGVTDMTLTLAISGAALAFWLRRYYLFYLLTAVAVLTKGPIGFFPFVFAGAYLLVQRQWRRLREMKILPGLLLVTLVAAPWYVVMYNLHGAAFIDTFFGFHNITRFTTPEHPEGKLWYFYLPVLAVGFYPWIFLLPLALVEAWRAWRREGQGAVLYLMLWAALVFGFFSVSQTKLVSYILPLYPALALLTGWGLDRWLTRQEAAPWQWGLGLAGAVGLLAAGGLKVAQGAALPPGAAGLDLLAGVLAAGGLVGLALAWRRRFWPAFAMSAASMAAVFAVLMAAVLPSVQDYVSTKNLAADYLAVADKTLPVYIAKFYRPGFALYSGVYGEELKNENTLRQSTAPVYVVVKGKVFASWPTDMRARAAVLSRRGGTVLLYLAGTPGATAGAAGQR